ncbi:hypothetical protein B0A52_10410 [Exophiala mesophila]|uniref:Zn(2)-C6 fungal-type domain-containing protein n=1 Tax=Exophiala mesophila TaxID=212818 RepID=A0A438MS25_EXOME|nr:hypothetical protein B0A52_10410 [Exophiala mesophila]
MSAAVARYRKSSKSLKSQKERRDELAESISRPENIAMVACSECVAHGVVCYYDREQSVKCAECVRHQRSCDGTFSLEEFRKVGEQKKALQDKSRRKRKEIARLRRLLADAEEEDDKVQDSLSALEQRSNAMLHREMLALGVFDSLDASSPVALADPGFVCNGVVTTDSIDWGVVFDGNPESASG